MKNFAFDLKRLCQRNVDGSYATRVSRERVLSLAARELEDIGYRQMTAGSLKPKHVEALLTKWMVEGLRPGTIKNRMSHLRWLAEKIGKPSVIARDNDWYGIERRVFVTNKSKARDLNEAELCNVDDPYTRMSLRLQSEFGLRREESIKIRPLQADVGSCIRLQPSWTKGGKERVIPVRTSEQRKLLEDAKLLAKSGSLIPSDMSYVDQLRRFEYQCAKAGIDRVHGHRHEYAQQRYLQMTGWHCPAQGGSTYREMTAEQKIVDRDARLAISNELGHEREQITSIYLGR